MRAFFFIAVFFLSSAAFSQQDICGDYVQPYYADDMFTRLTIKPDGTFEYFHVYLGEQKEYGRWEKHGDMLFLSGCKSCETTELSPFKDVVPKLPVQWPFGFKHITIKGDSLFCVAFINQAEPRPRLIKKARK